ncbi:MAG TPA: ABC transporter ATP-binding protein [Candidatus Eisenbacteria bacterium]|uniref:ABC transporter ATP-binding protein n=1 Tax=Eiseniibacteriota bacterium TaxID=2212470 RepID=A0A7V2AV81_UNCEI|nr:ABC transporter ATP-binding protein [Candidatus Eisenbacteria bacterium]
MAEELLKVDSLKTVFRTEDGTARAVDGVSFTVGRGETVGLVGESGCGKSVTALSIMRLITDPPGRIESGSVIFEGRDLLSISEKEMRKVRGNDISIVFQEPLSSLNPVFTCGEQIREAIALHQKLGRGESKKKAIEMLRLVRIPDPEKRYGSYPHQMSGGMRQRVMIAMALSCQPKLLIADEPSTALDVSVQAQIIELLAELRDSMDMAILLITHDLAVVAQMADRVVVMYAGAVVEESPVRDLFASPAHPYTKGLIDSLPKLGQYLDRLPMIPGTVPDPIDLPPGCRFSDRCPRRFEKCAAEPPLFDLAGGRRARCWLREREGL